MTLQKITVIYADLGFKKALSVFKTIVQFNSFVDKFF